jgi:hypothetical protein
VRISGEVPNNPPDPEAVIFVLKPTVGDVVKSTVAIPFASVTEVGPEKLPVAFPNSDQVTVLPASGMALPFSSANWAEIEIAVPALGFVVLGVTMYCEGLDRISN